MKLIRHISVLVFVAIFMYFEINCLPGNIKNKPVGEPRHSEVVIHSDTVFLDTLKIPLKRIPPIWQLNEVAKVSLGKWSKLFIVLKIEESGYDGQNSTYALVYNNLVGMRYPNLRKTTARKRGYSNYCVFDHWYDCLIDFKYYMEHTEKSFIKYYQRKPKSDKEMIRFMHGSYNAYSQWYRDVFWLLDHFEYDQ